MGELGCDSDLAEEPLGRDTRCGPAPQHLQGDTPVMPQVLGEVHHGHSASTHFTLDRVLVLQRRLQNLELSDHIKDDDRTAIGLQA